MTETNTTLLQHLKTKNANIRKWVAVDPENRFAGTIVEDLEHWKKCGVETVEQFEHYELKTEHNDLYKEIYGIRPRWYNYSEMSAAEIQEKIDALLEEQ